MDSYTLNIDEFKKQKEYLVCVDSDGCVFDTMEIKWKECFIPSLIKSFELQGIAKYVRYEAERINLYSRYRGINRFAGLPILFKALDETIKRLELDFELPDISPISNWLKKVDTLSVLNLEKEYDREKEPILERAIIWSYEVNKVIKEMVYGIPPFKNVRDTLEDIKEFADIAVVSSANISSIELEWSEHKLDILVDGIFGQESGTKSECMNKLSNLGYKKDNVIMIGDAIGDLESANMNDVLFYPIIPDKEIKSWNDLRKEYLKLFKDNKYKDIPQKEKIKAFKNVLK